VAFGLLVAVHQKQLKKEGHCERGTIAANRNRCLLAMSHGELISFLFHETKEDLIDALRALFPRRGLENRELCIWGDRRSAHGKRKFRYCLKHAIPGFDDYFESRSLENRTRGPGMVHDGR